MIAAILAIAAAISALVEAILAVAAVIGIFEIIFDPKGSQRVGNLVGNIVTGAFAVATPILSAVEASLAPVAQAFLTSVNNNGSGIANIFKDPAAALATTAFTDAQTALAAIGESTADNAVATAGQALGNAFGFGLSSHAVSAAFEAAFPEKLNSFNALGPMLEKMAGFEEVAAAVREPLYEAAFGRSLQYHFRSIFKPELPSEQDAVLWHARQLITDDQLKVIFDNSGLKSEYETAFVTSAYRAVSPFIVARATATGAISANDLTDVLQFGGYRPIDIQRLITAFTDVAVDPYRRQALGAMARAAENGLIAGPDYTDEINAILTQTDKISLINTTISYAKMVKLADLLEKSTVEGYRDGTVTDQQFIPDLEAGGISEDWATAKYNFEAVRRIGRANVKAIADAAKLATAQQRAQVKTLSAQYLKGIIDAGTLTASLALAGVDPTIAAYLVEYLAAKAQATAVYKYGVKTDKDGAAQLAAKVDALKYQVEYAGLGIPGATAALQSYGITPDWVAALTAQWAAEFLKTVQTP